MRKRQPDPSNLPIEVLCEQFSVQSPNTKPVDALWDTYAHSPARAEQDFNTYFPEYRGAKPPTANHETRDVPGRVRVIAAFGGILVAAEAGDPRAQEVYDHMRHGIRRIGYRALNLIAQPVGDTSIDGAGSTVGIYLAASALDAPGYTAWSKSARPPKPEPGKTEINRPLEEIGLVSLQQRYRDKSAGSVKLMTLAYSEVARNTGAFSKFLHDPNDRISAQRIEDFVSTCIRFTGAHDLDHPAVLEQARQRLAHRFGPEMGEMFRVGLQLLRKREIHIKGVEVYSAKQDEPIFPDILSKPYDLTRDIDRWLEEELEGLIGNFGASPDAHTPTAHEETSSLDPTTLPKIRVTDEVGLSPSEFDPRLFIEETPSRPNDRKWESMFGGPIDQVINLEKPDAPALRIYRYHSRKKKRRESIKLTPPGGNAVFLDPDDVVMVYPRKDGRIGKKPTHVFQGVDDGLPEGFGAESISEEAIRDNRRPLDPRVEENASKLPQPVGIRGIAGLSFALTSIAVNKLLHPSRQPGNIQHVRLRKGDDVESITIYSTAGKQEKVSVMTPGGTLLRAGKFDVVSIVGIYGTWTTTLGSLGKDKGTGYFKL